MIDRTRATILALIAGLVVAVAAGVDPGLRLADSGSVAPSLVRSVVEALPEGSVVLVGFDADVGTYAEVRPTVRTLLDDLLARDATLAVISLTPEGRVLATAELRRLATSGVAADRLIDLGFVSGAEAGLVAVASALNAPAPAQPFDRLAGSPVRLAALIGGNDLGPRSWVEQVAPRVPGLPMIAIAPSVLLPELQPYVDSGQLAALVATPRDGAAYRDAPASPAGAHPGPTPMALLVGMVVAIGVLAWSLAARVIEPRRRPVRGDTR